MNAHVTTGKAPTATTGPQFSMLGDRSGNSFGVSDGVPPKGAVANVNGGGVVSNGGNLLLVPESELAGPALADDAAPDPKDPTGAERQRRYRERQAAKSGDAATVTATVTPAVTVDRVTSRESDGDDSPSDSPSPGRNGQDFDWSRDKGDVVVQQQQAVAVYWNPRDSLVIRQERDWNDDDDHYIVVAAQNLPTLIERLQAELHSLSSPGPFGSNRK